ncbi:HNH endonuclease signature motif containing protein [Streptomyces sp. NPDC019443]|uniref:HNH endonuclease signature motif containing protein n=1 Tax=Streptomyces sp. NPDC019443 TaxID=3365061 RepID=UPI0037A22907
MTRSVADRFWAKVKHDGPVSLRREAPGRCWLWVGAIGARGYGRIFVDGQTVPAHRWSYEAEVGSIQPGLVIDHLCRNRACVNPAHLEPVTNQVNTLRGIGMTARRARTTHCPAGHEYAGANLYVSPRGDRRCRICEHLRAVRRGRKPSPIPGCACVACPPKTTGGTA